MKNKRSLRTQMLLQYAAIVLICMIVVPAIVAKKLDSQMKTFLENRLLEGEQEIAQLMQGFYASGGEWNLAQLSQIYSNALHLPVVSVTLVDNYGRLIWEFRRADLRPKRQPGVINGMGGRQREQMMRVTESIVNERVITFDDRPVGKVRFIYMPFMESREGIFIAQFNRRLFHSVGLVLVAASLIAFVMANRISRPILNVANRALLISKGKYRSQEEMKTNIKELQILIESMDRLGLSLEEQEALRRRLMGDVAHELRSPVAIVKSHLEAFEDGVWDPTPERLKLTVEEIDRLSSLITQVERLALLESGDERLELSNVNLSDELKKTAISMEPLFNEKSLTLSREIEPMVVMAMDIVKMRRAVENLMQNALRYTDSGGEVTLSLKTEADIVKISVEDSGIGICENNIPHIFERFYRTDQSRTRESGGMGIGLAITKAIVEAHGGNIAVESKEGSGSRFTITLPTRMF